ncbi:MAG TPA: hypothetical protein ENN55_03410, partial [Firmicutes bacterium]|nr:hypothetical protein [Bacillota bacterium]
MPEKFIKHTVLFIVFLFFAVLSLQARPMLEEDVYLDAMQTFNEKKYKEAAVKFDDFMKKFPKSSYRPNILLKQAELADDFFEKKELYEKVILEYQNTEYEAEAVYSLGRAYYARNDHASAGKYLLAMLQKHSNTFWIEPSYYYLFLSLSARKKYKEAENIYRDYNSKNKFYIYKSRMDLAYANVLMMQNEYAKAAEVYVRLLVEHDGKEKYIYAPDIYARLAECYEKTGSRDKREEVLKEMKNKYPGAKESKQLVEAVVPAAKEAEIETQNVVSAPVHEKKESFYTVQLGAFSTQRNADRMKKQYEDKGYSMAVRKSGNLYLVQVGRFDSYGGAKKFA